MDSATILVLVLSAGVVALLAWFEINSRQNEAGRNQKSTHAQSWLETSQRQREPKCKSDSDTKKVA